MNIQEKVTFPVGFCLFVFFCLFFVLFRFLLIFAATVVDLETRGVVWFSKISIKTVFLARGNKEQEKS